MKQVTIDPSFWELFPDAQVNILFANGIDNHDTDNNYDERKKLLANATHEDGNLNQLNLLLMSTIVFL